MLLTELQEKGLYSPEVIQQTEKLLWVLLNYALDVFPEKQAAYGANNIAKFGEFGVLVRASDKVERLRNLLQSQRQFSESIEDSWRDLLGYGAIGVLCRRGEWNGSNHS